MKIERPTASPHTSLEIRSPALRSGLLRALCQHFREDCAHLVVDNAIGGKDIVAEKLERSTRNARDTAASFRDQQRSRRLVPRIEFQLPKAIEAARRHRAEVQRRRARTSNAVRKLREAEVELNVET